MACFQWKIILCSPDLTCLRAGYRRVSAMRKVLVTGGAGYIGSHTCKALRRVGFEPIVYDNLSRGNQWAVKYGPLEVGHLADSARLMSVLERYRPIAVMHFAALAYVGE